MQTRHPIDLALSGVSTAAGALTLRSDSFKPGGLLCLQLASMRSDDTDSVVCTVSLERAGSNLDLETIVMTSKTYTYNYHHTVFAPSDYAVVFIFSSAGATKPVYAWVFGYWTEFPA